ncbi:hypothetical protein XENTR_v10019950 [Xenopus tropicalis]|nr:hypothetical protein XENTR_v10019950 [Xenopus tropicalis]
MLGIKKGGKRLVVIPPALGYGSQGVAGRIPPNATLAFEVDIKRMKVRDQGSDRQSVGSRDSPVSLPDCQPAEMLPQPPSSVPPKPGEPAIRAKSNSISEQLANPDVAKAKLISRMAKMGQPMLPFISGTPQPDSSDSEIEDPNTQRAVPSPVAPLPVRPTPQMNHVPAAQVPPAVPQTVPTLQGTSAALMPVGPIQPQALAPGISPGFQPYVQYPYAQSASTQLQSVAPVYPPQIQTPSHFQAGGDVTSFLMTEARQHSTEIRMSIGKIADKIDTLASKVDNLQKENSASSSHLLPGITSITMESAMIMNNIQRIIQENERLKHEVLEKSSRIEEQNGKISELINRNQKNMSLLPLSEVQETSEHSKTRAKSEKETRRQLEVRLSALEDEVSDLKAEKENLEKSLAERKRRSQQERQRAEEEQEELRRSLQEEVEELRQVLRKTREQAAAEQVSSRSRNGQRQSELEEQAAQLQPLRDQALALRLNEQKVAELQEQAAQLQPLREKYERLRGQMSALLEEQTKWQSQEAPGTDTTEEVKKIMNRVFQGLRGEFELEEMYSGREVLGTIMSTIKATTLQLLKQNQPEAAPQSSGEEEEEEDEDEAQVVSPAPRAAVVPPDQEGNSDPKEDWASGAASEEASAALGEHGEAEEERSEGRDFTIEQVGEDGSDPVQVIQENLEETSALVHMMSSDMESSTVTPAPGAGKEPEHLRGEPLVSDPGATPTDPGATPTDPGATPTDPGATPTDLGATPIEPRATPIEPRATPIEPRATPIEPRATPTDPRATPTEAHPVAHDLRSHSRSPVAPQTQDSETPSSAADGGNLEDGKLEGPPPLGSDEETGSPVPPPLAQRPSAKPDRAQTQMERPLAEPKQKQKMNIGLEESDDEDLFKTPPIKPQGSKPEEEEEEEEVSMKGCPPPAPLFGDDEEDDDDLDWLG